LGGTSGRPAVRHTYRHPQQKFGTPNSLHTGEIRSLIIKLPKTRLMFDWNQKMARQVNDLAGHRNKLHPATHRKRVQYQTQQIQLTGRTLKDESKGSGLFGGAFAHQRGLTPLVQ